MSEEIKTINNEPSAQEHVQTSNTDIEVLIESNEDNLNELVDNSTKKNKKKIKCIRCDSYILQPNSCIFTKTETIFEGNS